MKNILLSCLFLYSLASVAQNGKYIPFPSRTIVYTYSTRGNGSGSWYSVARMEVEGDTLINGLHYSKYFVAEANKSGNSSPFIDLKTVNRVVGGIRNDIATKKVYLYTFGTNKEELLYDFDLHVGDTLFKDDGYRFYRSLISDDPIPKIDTVWVSRIDSVLMPHDGLYHRRFNFKTKFQYNSSTAYLINSDSVFEKQSEVEIKINPLIEGVGIDFNPVTKYVQFEFAFDYYLFCRSIDGKIAYTKDTLSFPPFMYKANCNSIITGIDDENSTSNAITIYPNPSNGKFEMRLTNNEYNSFEIYNLLGVKVLNSAIANTFFEVNLPVNAQGIYFIKLYKKNGQSTTRKIMIE